MVHLARIWQNCLLNCQNFHRNPSEIGIDSKSYVMLSKWLSPHIRTRGVHLHIVACYYNLHILVLYDDQFVEIILDDEGNNIGHSTNK